jgi:hypothetical protein
MATIYSTQDYFTIVLSTIDEEGNDTLPVGLGITSYKVALKSPRGIITEYVANYNPETKEVYYTSEDDVFLTPHGEWTTWIVVYTSNNRRIPGTPVTFTVSEEGKF